jgi:hypothetical protein
MFVPIPDHLLRRLGGPRLQECSCVRELNVLAGKSMVMVIRAATHLTWAGMAVQGFLGMLSFSVVGMFRHTALDRDCRTPMVPTRSRSDASTASHM